MLNHKTVEIVSKIQLSMQQKMWNYLYIFCTIFLCGGRHWIVIQLPRMNRGVGEGERVSKNINVFKSKTDAYFWTVKIVQQTINYNYYNHNHNRNNNNMDIVICCSRQSVHLVILCNKPTLTVMSVESPKWNEITNPR